MVSLVPISLRTDITSLTAIAYRPSTKLRTWTMTPSMILVVVATLAFSCSGLPTAETDEFVQRIVRSEDVDGYDMATLYAVDTATKEETRQTRRDIETHASDTSSDKPSFSLQLTSGERLRMSLVRRSVDTSGATFTEITEEGEREINYERRDCFFSGDLEGGEEGFASLAMCDGKLTGSVTTARRDYDIHTLPQTSQKRDADDVMHLLVTWKDNQRGQRDLDDVLEIPDVNAFGSPKQNDTRRSVSDGKATVEIGEFVDRFFIENVKTNLGITTNTQIINLILQKWSAAYAILSDETKVGWDLTLRLVSVVIMRTDPTWYKVEPNQKIGERMHAICVGTKDRSFDQVTLHTGQTTDVNRVGLAWLDKVCIPRWRCSVSRAANTNHRIELHELGHSLGLNHDGNMQACIDGTDPTKGFMGGNKYHFRACYKDVLAEKLPQKSCLFSNAYSSYERQFH
ncbi:A disintegrin and metalloproteinase with thrombospondin motifs 14-like [Babylonia areolata]|uniref:A disintegrin and metalloproteinase with thrombospondin motifs 14-like n=1 Tax=Babylonia areolata TaxID=304850 RepID=UPI003FD5F48E